MSSFPQWAKVTYNGTNKRIAHPLPNLDLFRQQAVSHFRLFNEEVRLLYDSQSLFDQTLSMSQIKDTSLENKKVVNSQTDYAQLMEKHCVYQRNDGSFTTPRFVLELDHDRIRGQNFAKKLIDQTSESFDHFQLVESFEIGLDKNPQPASLSIQDAQATADDSGAQPVCEHLVEEVALDQMKGQRIVFTSRPEALLQILKLKKIPVRLAHSDGVVLIQLVEQRDFKFVTSTAKREYPQVKKVFQVPQSLEDDSESESSDDDSLLDLIRRQIRVLDVTDVFAAEMASRGAHLHLVGSGFYASDTPAVFFEKKAKQNPYLKRDDEPWVIPPAGIQKLLRSQYMPQREEEHPNANRIANISIKSTLSQPWIQPQPQQTLFNQIWSSARQIIQQPVLSLTLQSCVLSSDADLYAEVDYDGNPLKVENLTWTILNRSNVAWPKSVELTPIISSPWVLGNSSSSVCELRPKTEGTLQMTIELPADYKSDHLLLLFKLRSETGVYFGASLLVVIKVSHRQKPCVSSKQSLFQNLTDLNEINSVAKHSQRCDSLTDHDLFQLAEMLSQRGHGTFNRCLLVVRAMRGDYNKSESFLDKILSSESTIEIAQQGE